MAKREDLGRFSYDALPRSPFMGPPLPEGFNIWWPNFMLASELGLITEMNMMYLNAKKNIANKIAGADIVPNVPYPHKVW